MSHEDSIHRSIGQLYDAVLEPENWQKALKGLSDVLGGTGVVLASQDPITQQHRFGPVVRVDPQAVSRRLRDFNCPETNPFLRVTAALPFGRTFERRSLISDQEVLRTQVYNELYLPMKAFPCTVSSLGTDSNTLFLLLTNHHDFSKTIRSHEKRALEGILPHLQRVCQLQLRLAKAHNLQFATEGALNKFGIGAILIDTKGHVCFVNERAEAFLASSGELTIRARRLTALRSKDTANLRKLIDGAIRTTRGRNTGAGGAMALPRSPSSRPSRPLSVLVSPLPREELWGIPNPPAAIVFVSDPAQREGPSGQVLMHLYGLTRAEAALATLLLEGRGLSFAAENMGISLNTAKTHEKHIFAKTETTRQAEFVRLILGSPAGLFRN